MQPPNRPQLQGTLTEAASEPVLRIMPFVCGIRTHERVVIRRADSPDYLTINPAEYQALEDLRQHPCPVSEFLGRHLNAPYDLDFKAAIALLLRLYQGRFIAHDEGGIAARLDGFGGAGLEPGKAASASLYTKLAGVLDLPLVSFDTARVHPALAILGQGLASPLCLLLFALTVAAQLLLLGGDQIGTVLAAQTTTPELLLAKSFAAFSLAASSVALLQLAALAGSGVEFLGGRLRLTGLCILRLAVRDDDIMMRPKTVLVRYHLLSALLPWFLAAVVGWAMNFFSLPPFASQLAAAYGVLGILSLCPLLSSPVIKIAGGLLASLNMLEQANAYLAQGLLSSLFSRKPKGKDGTTGRGNLGQNLVVACACLSLLWLYVVGLAFTDLLLGSATELWFHAGNFPLKPLRGVAAFLLLLGLSAAMLLPLMRLIIVPLQNLLVVAKLPLRRARRGLGAYSQRNVTPSAAVAAFLREIPILADLSPEQLNSLTAELQQRSLRRGATMIQKGEAGSEFFILAEGSAKVVVSSPGEPEEVADILRPGDSFGEIALVEHTTRTASIVALSPVKVLVLDRVVFDRLFPEGSVPRQRLSRLLRQIKLVLESQALSHLSPRQIKQLLSHSHSLELASGDYLIVEDADGDAAYLIESGTVQVSRKEADAPIALLGRGSLVGAISLIKDIKRTASVRAATPVSCLKIDKASFLKICTANVFVAHLVLDLSESQLASQKKAG